MTAHDPSFAAHSSMKTVSRAKCKLSRSAHFDIPWPLRQLVVAFRAQETSWSAEIRSKMWIFCNQRDSIVCLRFELQRSTWNLHHQRRKKNPSTPPFLAAEKTD